MRAIRRCSSPLLSLLYSKAAALLCLGLLAPSSQAILINEVHANPLEDDSLNEWIELYNEGPQQVNVSGWLIGDEKENDTLEGGLFEGHGTVIPGGGFAIITDDATRVYNNFKVEQDAIRLYVQDGAIGNGLKNSGETLALFTADLQLIHSINYTETVKGLSKARFKATFSTANATPGFQNNGSKVETPATGCEWYLEVLTNKTTFESDEEFEWQIRAQKEYGNKTLTSATASIRDLTGNFVRVYRPWTNHTATSRKSSTRYSPNLERGKAYLLTAEVEVACEDQVPENNHIQQTFTLLGTPLANRSAIQIERVYDLGSDDIASFGQTVRAKLNIYKGDTRKEVVAVWIENEDDKITKQSKVSLPDAFTHYAVTLPVQIKPNCDLEYDADRYELRARGLGTEGSFRIEVAGSEDSICSKESVAQQQPSLLVDIAEYPAEIKSTQEFTTAVYLENNDNRHHNIKMWSYLFKGSKSYSGERERNLKEVFIKKRGSKQTLLKNQIQGIPAGDYKLIVRYTIDGSEKEKRLLRDVSVIGEREETSTIAAAITPQSSPRPTASAPMQIPLSGNVVTVYESTTYKTKELGVYLFAALVTLYAIILTWKR